ncbi:MAG: hypothetical protein CM1200mP15_06930 [Dehalococcoidia bacterium]|nr:MAG: hypothetical protein CM1200mP15_06930 [Dehalococcoidia bacterium]
MYSCNHGARNKRGWLADGSTLIAAGPTTWRAKEVDSLTLTRSEKIVVDSIDQAPMSLEIYRMPLIKELSSGVNWSN